MYFKYRFIMKKTCAYIFISSLLILFTTGCITYSEQQPSWIENPADGVVGSAGMHVRGRHEQTELAITRARTRLAARLGVDISSIQTIREEVVNDKGQITSTRETKQKIENKTVTASTRAIWHDKKRNIVYVWVIPIK